MNKTKDKMLVTLSIVGMAAVIIGAFGAHGLKAKLTPELLSTYNIGVSYHFYHLMAMGFAYLLYASNPHKWARIAFWSFFTGIILFSGSLYLLSTRNLIGLTTYKWLGPITPIGGVLFIFGWISILISNLKKEQ